jgi:hypothetical protein
VAAPRRPEAGRTKTCNCGRTVASGGECEECRQRRLAARAIPGHELLTVLHQRGSAETRNPNDRRSGERSTQNPGAGAAAPAAAEVGEAAGRAAAAPLERRRAELKSGPRYKPRGAVAPTVGGGRKSAGPWDFDAVFEHDPAHGIFAGCGEIHQDIKWDAAAAASFKALFGTDVPHGGFPAGHPAGVWIEDRDSHDKRYGRRSGPFSDPIVGGDEYTNAAGRQDELHGATYHGNDNPDNWPAALAGRWTFMVLAFDMCNRGVQVGSADFITVDW